MNRAVPISLTAGLVFGAGLALSGMADPARIRGFLDVAGHWDPTLLFVMAGAILPMAIAWRIAARGARPFAAERFELPDTRGIDAKLAGGALLFGVGWGIAGLCPGPAIADLAIAPGPAALFVGAMLAGMVAYRLVGQRSNDT